MRGGLAPVHLGHDERDVGIEPKRRGVVHDERARGYRAWGDLPSGPQPIPVQPGSGLESLMAPTAPATHVPVITPTDKPKGELPPRIEPDPLPPV